MKLSRPLVNESGLLSVATPAVSSSARSSVEQDAAIRRLAGPFISGTPTVIRPNSRL